MKSEKVGLLWWNLKTFLAVKEYVLYITMSRILNGIDRDLLEKVMKKKKKVEGHSMFLLTFLRFLFLFLSLFFFFGCYYCNDLLRWGAE